MATLAIDYEQMSKDLAPYEDAARIWCADHQQDPDRQIRTRHPGIAGAFVFHPYWLEVAARIQDVAELMGALQRSLKKDKTGGAGHA